MKVKAKLNNLKIAPRKVRLVADLIRGMNVNDAIYQLKYLNKKSAPYLRKLVESAIANAENDFHLKKDNLYISGITVDEGITLKRWMPRAFGRAATIRKRSSKVTLILEDKEIKKEVDVEKKENKKQIDSDKQAN